MPNFEFEKQRDDLAEELKKTRAEDGGREKAREKLTEAQETNNYQVSKKLHRVAQSFSHEDIDVATRKQEVIDDPEKWDVEDVSEKISQEQKLLIDAEILRHLNIRRHHDDNDTPALQKISSLIDDAFDPEILGPETDAYQLLMYRQEGKRLKKQIGKFLDELTDGRYRDGHNFTHSILGQPFHKNIKHVVGKPFNRYSTIIPSHERPQRGTGGGFWVSVGSSHYSSLENPSIIISPNNPSARHLVEEDFYPTIQEVMREYEKELLETRESMKKRMRFNEAGFVGFCFDYNEMKTQLPRLLFLAGFPITPDLNDRDMADAPVQFHFGVLPEYNTETGSEKLPSWMEISDCIVDLPAGKVWKRKYSEEELVQVKQDQEKYKKWIEDNILHCSFEELVQSAQGDK